MGCLFSCIQEKLKSKGGYALVHRKEREASGKKLKPGLLAGLLVLTGLVMAVAGAWWSYQTKILVVVNGERLTRDQLYQEMYARVGPQAMEDLISKKLILQEGKKLGIEVTPEEVREERPSFQISELPDALRKNVERQGWKSLMPVQEKVIPILMEGKDLVVQSRTGSGKTAAFALPILMRIDPRREDVQGLILTPTRELAEQVHGVVRDLAEGLGLRSVAVYGGVGYGPQIEAFHQKVHIIVGTPGRIIDHLSSNRFSLANLRFLVLDEADEMLSMGFFPSIRRILAFLRGKVQTALFSATVPPGVAALASRFTREPETLSLSSDLLHVEEVDHIYYVVDGMYKDRTLLKLIEMDNPQAALIFCNTKKEVEYLGVFLQNFGYDGAYLSSDLSQAEPAQHYLRPGNRAHPDH